MDRDAPRGRLRRWAAIFAALIRAGGAWIRRALLRHRLSRRAASPAVNKEGRKDADGVCSKIRPPPRRNRDVGDIGKRRTSVGDIGERRTNVADIENLGAAQGPKKVLQAATSRAAAAAHSVHQLDSKNAEPLTRPTPAAPSATSRAAAAHSAHQLDSNNAETLARPVPAKPLPLARPAQAAPSKEVKDSTRHARVVNSKKLLARPAPAATRPVRRQKKVAAVPHQPHQVCFREPPCILSSASPVFYWYPRFIQIVQSEIHICIGSGGQRT